MGTRRRRGTGWLPIFLALFGVAAAGSGVARGAASIAEALRAEAVEAAGSALEALADSKGALGYYWDDEAKQYVVVVPRQGGSSFEASDASGLAADVRVESRDITRAEVDAIGDALSALRPSMKGLGYGYYFDAASGMMILQSEAPLAAFDAVTKEFPGRIEFHLGKFNLTGWSNDTEPYKGGAFLSSANTSCTSGFVAENWNGAKRMISAGHCFSNGTATNMGTVVRPSSEWWPDFDILYILGEGYTAGIYDTANTTRPVTTAANPAIGSNYCTTGRATGFVCTWIVRSLNVTICYPSGYPGCAHGLAGFLPPTDQGTQYTLGGDSGGPLWFKHANGGAGIRGVLSGTYWDLATGRVYSYATMYQKIVNQTGLTAVLL
jgi:hypothetical protein